MTRHWKHYGQISLALLACLFPAREPWAAAPSPAPAVEQADEITLDQALALALERNPALLSFSWELRAAEARRIQAAVRPNPVASLAIENAGGTETTLSFAQLIELGGKRAARVEAARAGEGVRSREWEALRLSVVAEVTRSFYDALAAERLLLLEDESIEIAEEIKAAVSMKVKAGAVSPAEEARADLEVQTSRLRREDAEQERALSHVRLASTWAQTDPVFSRVSGNIDSLASLPLRAELLQRLDNSPDVSRLLAEIAASDTRLDLARAERVPDVELEAGYRRLADSDANTFVAGLSIPLPIFNRNEGNIALSQAERSKAEAELARARVERARTLAEKYSLLARLRLKSETLRAEILPTTERTFHEVKTGYERGRFSYVDLLEARRTLIAVRRELLSALTSYHFVTGEMELLIGGALQPGGATSEGQKP